MNNKIIENEKQNREELFRLMRENPDLPVVPMVDLEVVADDSYDWWMGHWGRASIDEYIITGECVRIKSVDDEESVLTEVFGYDEYEEMTDEEAAKAYSDLEWTKAIMVNITT